MRPSDYRACTMEPFLGDRQWIYGHGLYSISKEGKQSFCLCAEDGDFEVLDGSQGEFTGCYAINKDGRVQKLYEGDIVLLKYDVCRCVEQYSDEMTTMSVDDCYGVILFENGRFIVRITGKSDYGLHEFLSSGIEGMICTGMARRNHDQFGWKTEIDTTFLHIVGTYFEHPELLQLQPEE